MTAVAILAAGSGTRLGQRTAYFNKCLLRVGDKAIISHIVDYFPKDYKFVVVIGYLGGIVKQYLSIAHPGRTFIFVKQEELNGPGGALQQCKEHLQEPFYIWCSDTLVKNFSIEENNNWIGISSTNNIKNSYSSVSYENDFVVTGFYEKNSLCKTNSPYIGCAFIKDYEDFWKSMNDHPRHVNNELQVSGGFKLLFSVVRNFIWYDTGDDKGLKSTRKIYKARIENLDKLDEELYFLDDRVIKYFYHPELVKNRIIRTQRMAGTCPPILDYANNFYSYEYIEGKDLFNIDNPQDYMRPLLAYANNTLWNEKRLNRSDKKIFNLVCEKFYHQKTKARVSDFYFKTETKDVENTINGKTIGTLGSLLKKINWDSISQGRPSGFHGDFNFSNIILAKDGEFRFIDWRQDFGGLMKYGDTYYDLAKMYSGFIFPHDVVKSKKFSITISNNNVKLSIDKPDKYQECEKILFNFINNEGFDEKKVKQLGAIILLNMSPLHESPLDVYLYYRGKELLSQNA